MWVNASNLHKKLVIFLAFCGLSAHAYEFAGGTGEPSDPYQIATAGQLISIGSDRICSTGILSWSMTSTWTPISPATASSRGL